MTWPFFGEEMGPKVYYVGGAVKDFFYMVVIFLLIKKVKPIHFLWRPAVGAMALICLNSVVNKIVSNLQLELYNRVEITTAILISIFFVHDIVIYLKTRRS